MVQFKTKCVKCKTNYVTVTSRSAYGAVCLECDKAQMKGEIKDPALKKLLDLPEEFYQQSSFLRSIKINCLKYGNLSERQIEVFKKVADDMAGKASKVKAAAAEEKKPAAKAKKKKA